VVSPDPLSPTQTFLDKPPKNTEEGPDDPEPADKGIQMEFSSDYLCRPSIEVVTKNYL
jgi:hypothetical protein